MRLDQNIGTAIHTSVELSHVYKKQLSRELVQQQGFPNILRRAGYFFFLILAGT